MFFRISLAVILVDQVSKFLIWKFSSNTDIIGNVLRISLVKNTGAAFGILPGASTFFILASLAASIVLVYYYRRTEAVERLKRVLIAVIFGGAVGNLIDRLAMGEVRDFIDVGIGVHRWPVFNVADMAVSLGALCLAIFYMTGEGRGEGERRASGAGAAIDGEEGTALGESAGLAAVEPSSGTRSGSSGEAPSNADGTL